MCVAYHARTAVTKIRLWKASSFVFLTEIGGWGCLDGLIGGGGWVVGKCVGLRGWIDGWAGGWVNSVSWMGGWVGALGLLVELKCFVCLETVVSKLKSRSWASCTLHVRVAWYPREPSCERAYRDGASLSSRRA